jgi:hypothetical protein
MISRLPVILSVSGQEKIDGYEAGSNETISLEAMLTLHDMSLKTLVKFATTHLACHIAISPYVLCYC